MASHKVNSSRRYVYGFRLVTICRRRLHRTKHQRNLQSVAVCITPFGCDHDYPPVPWRGLGWPSALTMDCTPVSTCERTAQHSRPSFGFGDMKRGAVPGWQFVRVQHRPHSSRSTLRRMSLEVTYFLFTIEHPVLRRYLRAQASFQMFQFETGTRRRTREMNAVTKPLYRQVATENWSSTHALAA
jgi:hypothetical protein